MDEILAELALGLNVEYLGIQKDSYHRFDSKTEQTKLLLETLWKDSRFWCDHLISISGNHKTGPPEILEVHYHLASIPTKIQVHVVTSEVLANPTDRPEFDTVTDLWKTANWHERETAELFGITFKGHPDLRNLLLPANWEGFPLRKNYIEQVEFHGIKVKYERD